ncbi:acyl-CoA/acyl-ACP dehydrogenase [Streptomyces sp. RB6PN25]|uniref:Acyl-CoA/acyl-ACP dehydrogenase n=1 Tax=Streptomyces humicola TaxID=2953240 RepID=A0ABT1PTS7_9ACTN|nr:acyl-CoA dehydrogenase family protein [Streptomyces humicola]MCQ4081077.1 acyl-CoA/acyl-ACP dehydrogenase [Streptomyces humicola]
MTTPPVTDAFDDLAAQPGTPRVPGLADRVAEVVAVTEEHLARTDREAAFPVEALDALRRTRLLGLLVPPQHGGLGGTLADLVEAAQLLGRSDMSVGMIFAMHCQQAAAVVRYAHEPLRTQLLPRIAAGEVYLASVTTESGKGGHLLTSEAPLHQDGARLAIDRFAPIVTGGAHADGFLITMRSPDADSANEVSLVYADRETLRISGSGDWQPMGMRASHSIPMKLQGTVPAHHVVGEHGNFREIADKVFGPLAHLGWSAVWLGTAAGALSRVLRLLRSPAGKKQFDLRSELLLTRISRARQRLESVHALLQRTLRMVASGEDLSVPSRQLLLNSLKITASQECFAAVDELIEAVGLRHGYLKDSQTRLELVLRDLRSAALNYSNDRLHLADGRMALLDQGVRFA